MCPSVHGGEELLGGRYRLGERVREGRAFRVYAGTDAQTGEPVRIRMLRGYVARDAGMRLAFRHALDSLPEPVEGLALPLDAVGSEGTAAVIEPDPGGRCLAQELEGGLLESAVALGRFEAIARVLTGLHAQRRAHGLLSPLEVWTRPDGSAVITGVCLAQAFGGAGVPGAEGNPYLAPEQRAGELPVEQSDVWALGVLLVELLTGRCPSIEDLRSGGWRRGVPSALQRPLTVALSANPSERFRHAQAFAEAVRGVGAATAESPPASPPRSTAARPPQPYRATPAAVRGEPAGAGARATTCLVWLIASLIVPAVIALPVLGVWHRWENSVPPEVVVPDLSQTHMDQRDASQALAQVGLKLEIVDEEFNPEVAEGAVLWQDPAAGKIVRKGRPVEVRISRGAKAVRVPDVTNGTADEATNALKAVGLVVGDIQKGSSRTFPEGVVLSQAPKAGRLVSEGGKINLLVSEGASAEDKAASEAQEGATGSRNAVVQFTVPRGEESQRVRIRVTDDKGARAVYDQLQEPGDSVRQSLAVFGKANVEILVGETVAETRVIE